MKDIKTFDEMFAKAPGWSADGLILSNRVKKYILSLITSMSEEIADKTLNENPNPLARLKEIKKIADKYKEKI